MKVAFHTSQTKLYKLIDVRFHHLRYHIDKGTVFLQYVPFGKNLAEPFTKSVNNRNLPLFARLVHDIDVFAPNLTMCKVTRVRRNASLCPM